MLRETLIHLSESEMGRRIATDAPFARSISRRFVAGETLDDAVRVVREVNDAGMTASLDYLGESVSSRQEAREAAEMCRTIIERIAHDRFRSNISVKLTQLGQDIDQDFLHSNIEPVLDLAAEREIFVRFDMESSDYTQSTLDLFERLWNEGRRNIGVVLQSYLYRTEQDTRWANRLGARVRLCKGAYDEPERVAFPQKSDVDANFVHCAKLLLAEGNYPGIATHDEAMIDATRRFVREQSIDVSSFEFQMLYGVRRDFQRMLVDEGFNLRIYIPFGEAWYPYFMRRMAERPANMFFVLGSVVRESPLGFLLGRNGGAGR